MFRRRIRPTMTQVIFASVLMAMLITPFAVAQTGGSDSGRVTKDDARYAFLARNIRAGDGGAGAFACNSDTGAGREPCLNMVNKGTGLAAAFRTRGLTGFRLQTSGSGEATPFLLDKNATKKVDFLNADQVDGQSANEIGRERFARVATDGTPVANSGNGLATTTPVTHDGAGTYTVTFADDVSKCSYQATSADTTNPRFVAADTVAANPKQVRVVTRDPAAAPTDTAFNLTVNC
jgi:hypothetical protein